MSKFNQKQSMLTTNQSGYTAYAMGDKERLVTQVLTSFFHEEKYYGDNTDKMLKTCEKVLNGEPRFVANLALYARKEMHLRSVAHALTAILAHSVKGKEFVKEVVAGVVERPDDITEILAYYLQAFGKPIPNSLKKALGNAVAKFNAYQISKYNGGSSKVKFRDVLRLTHPAPKNREQQELFSMILNDNLPVAERWETELSREGNNTEVWDRLIEQDKLGYMAMLRNLRNIINADSKHLAKVYEKLADKEQVLKSKQLPFRYFSAYREIHSLDNCTNKALDALETAIGHSVENLPRIKGKTVIAIDVSGSMGMTLSTRSKVKCADIARLLAVLASRICDEYIVYTFDTDLEKVNISSHGDIIGTAIRIPFEGGGTDLGLALEEMLEKKIHADRLIMISDNEINTGWDYRYGRGPQKTCQSLAELYRREINPELWVHAIDLQGYGTQQFIGGKTNIIAGWSERVLEFIALAEEGIETQVKRIQNYHLA